MKSKTSLSQNNPNNLDRRSFLKKLFVVTGLSTGALYLGMAPENWPLSRRDFSGLRGKPVLKPFLLNDFRVAKPLHAKEIGVGHGNSVRERLLKALNAVGGIEHYIKPGDIVLIKPNVAFDRSPFFGATTAPEILEELIKLLLFDCRAGEVRIADNPIESAADCFIKTGLDAVARKFNVRICLPDPQSFRVLHTPGASLIENWLFFHRPFIDVDKVIGLATVKDHNLCQASLGIKNWYGLLGGLRNHFHQNIHEVISELSIMIKATLTILDGSRILMRNGPTGGNPNDVLLGNTVIAGVDPVAIDAWAFEHLLGRGQKYPHYLFLAEKKGGGFIAYRDRIGIVL